MQLPLQIAVRNTEIAEDVKTVIRGHAEKLEQFYDRITACRVLVEVPQRHPAGTPIAYRVRLDLTVPGSEIVINRKPRGDVLTAVQDAFHAAERRLQEYARRQRGDVKQHGAATP
jgi:ribosome-associated translation inhibitor RaiA